MIYVSYFKFIRLFSAVLSLDHGLQNISEGNFVHFDYLNKSKREAKDQETIQSSTKPHYINHKIIK